MTSKKHMELIPWDRIVALCCTWVSGTEDQATQVLRIVPGWRQLLQVENEQKEGQMKYSNISTLKSGGTNLIGGLQTLFPSYSDL